MINEDMQGGETGIVKKEDAYDATGLDTVRYWLAELDLSKQAHDEWLKDAKRVMKLYRGKKGDNGRSRMNILWSNVSTLQPALFQKMPDPVVERRFKQKDPVARAVSEVVQRALRFQCDEGNAEGEVKAMRDDYLIAGRGVMKVIYEAQISEGYEPTPEEIEAALAAQSPIPEPVVPEIEYQSVRFEHIPYMDFLCAPEGRWSKKRWIAFRTRMNHARLKARFGDKASKITMTGTRLKQKEGDGPNPVAQMFQEAEVWEIWDREARKVIWISEGYKLGVLDESDDPYGLKGFFPCPKPMQVIETSEDGTPVPEYVLYEDQAAEINRLTGRLYSLSDKIRAVGAYAGELHDTLKNMLSQEDGTLIPIQNWAAMMEGKGFTQQIAWAPLRELVETLTALYKAREAAKGDLYEVSGISDIVRGASDAGETATAQRIKGQFATLRLDERKRLLAQNIAEGIGIMGELVAEHFEQHVLEAISDIDLLPDAMARQQAALQAALAGDLKAAQRIAQQPTWEDVMEVLRNDYRRAYAVRIETEDTIEVDRQADKQQRIEFLTAFVQLLQAMNAVVAGGALPYSVAKEIIMFSVRGFSQARTLEEVLEQIEEPQQADPGPSDAEIKAKIEEMKGQIDLLKQAREHQFKAVEGDKNRMVQVAQAQLQAQGDDANRDLQAASKVADMHERDKDRAHDKESRAEDRKQKQSEGQGA